MLFSHLYLPPLHEELVIRYSFLLLGRKRYQFCISDYWSVHRNKIPDLLQKVIDYLVLDRVELVTLLILGA